MTGGHRQLEHRRQVLSAQRQELPANNRLSRRLETFARRIRHHIDTLDFEQRQKLVRVLVEQVRVTGPAVEIHLRIPLDEPPSFGDAQYHPELIEGRHQDVSNQSRLRHLVEIYFSILRGKVLTPNDFASIDELANCITELGRGYSAVCKPFAWCFTRRDLEQRLREPSLQPQLVTLATAA